MSFLNANWSAPNNVYALTTTRIGGISESPYDSNNLALHVGDNDTHVKRNRELLIEALNLPSEPQWLEQTHSIECVVIEEDNNRHADAALTRQSNTVLAIMTADCLPIVICNTKGTEIAAIHAGWRGLSNGVIESTVKKMRSHPQELMAWIGPAICQQCYETGEEVRDRFIQQYPFSQSAFQVKNQRFYANLSGISERVLNHLGIENVYQSEQCTYETKQPDSSKNKYYSYRQESQTGRIATLIWFK